MQHIVPVTAIQIICTVHERIPYWNDNGVFRQRNKIVPVQEIIAGPAQQNVIAWATGQAIVTGPSIQVIIACLAIQTAIHQHPFPADPVIARSAEQHIIPLASVNLIVPESPIGIIVVTPDFKGIKRIIPKDEIVAGTPKELVVACSALQFIIAVPAIEQIVAQPAPQHILIAFAIETIAPGPPVHFIVPQATEDLLVEVLRIGNEADPVAPATPIGEMVGLRSKARLVTAVVANPLDRWLAIIKVDNGLGWLCRIGGRRERDPQFHGGKFKPLDHQRVIHNQVRPLLHIGDGAIGTPPGILRIIRCAEPAREQLHIELHRAEPIRIPDRIVPVRRTHIPVRIESCPAFEEIVVARATDEDVVPDSADQMIRAAFAL